MELTKNKLKENSAQLQQRDDSTVRFLSDVTLSVSTNIVLFFPINGLL